MKIARKRVNFLGKCWERGTFPWKMPEKQKDSLQNTGKREKFLLTFPPNSTKLARFCKHFAIMINERVAIVGGVSDTRPN